MRVFILGIGATGSLLAKLLVRQGHQVACGDRDPGRARAFLGERLSLSIQRVNARNLHGVVKAARGCHLLINTCPAVLNKVILRAALRLRVHYLDTASHLRERPFRPEQLRFDRQFREKHRTALIHAGAAPGLTNVLAVHAAAALETLERIQIRLFEGTASDDPVSQWSPDSSFDEAVSRPRLYRNGHFRFGTRFGEREVFRFPPPIGRVGVVLAAQDEVVTLPHILRLQQMDAKIGGPDMERLRRWYRQGKLNRSRGLVAARFPATPTPRVLTRLVRRGILRNARFAEAVLVYGQTHGRPVLIRWDATFPSLVELRRRGLSCSPIAWANAQLIAIFVKHFPRQLSGVQLPETLPTSTHRSVLDDVRSRGIGLTKKLTFFKASNAADET
jgi:Saccharopine dehydrogenase NADP binding domain